MIIQRLSWVDRRDDKIIIYSHTQSGGTEPQS